MRGLASRDAQRPGKERRVIRVREKVAKRLTAAERML